MDFSTLFLERPVRRQTGFAPAATGPRCRLPASIQAPLQGPAGLSVSRRLGPRRSVRFRRRSAHRAAVRCSGRGSRRARILPARCSPVRKRPTGPLYPDRRYGTRLMNRISAGSGRCSVGPEGVRETIVLRMADCGNLEVRQVYTVSPVNPAITKNTST